VEGRGEAWQRDGAQGHIRTIRLKSETSKPRLGMHMGHGRRGEPLALGLGGILWFAIASTPGMALLVEGEIMRHGTVATRALRYEPTS
jgi:hypothetical protein